MLRHWPGRLRAQAQRRQEPVNRGMNRPCAPRRFASTFPRRSSTTCGDGCARLVGLTTSATRRGSTASSAAGSRRWCATGRRISTGARRRPRSMPSRSSGSSSTGCLFTSSTCAGPARHRRPCPHPRMALDVLGLEGRDRAARGSGRLRRRSRRCVRRGRPLVAGIRVLRSASDDGHRSAPRRRAVGGAHGRCSATSASRQPGATGARSSRRKLGHASLRARARRVPDPPDDPRRQPARRSGGRVRRGRGVDVAALARGATQRS